MEAIDFDIQKQASEILLDIGVSIPMPAPMLLRVFGKKEIRIVIRRPCWGTLMRISRLWLSMEVDTETVKMNTNEQDLELMEKHGKTVAKIVAMGIVRGYYTGRLAPIVAWFLLWKVNPIFLIEAAFKLVTLSRVSDFRNTTILLSAMLMTKKMGLAVKGS
jgi:hypothetical protein